MEEEDVKVELEPEGTDLQETPAPDVGITIESLHAMIVELQGTVQNLQAVADQATPVEPAAVEAAAEEEPAADDSALLEDEGPDTTNGTIEPSPEEDLEDIDKLLSAN